MTQRQRKKTSRRLRRNRVRSRGSTKARKGSAIRRKRKVIPKPLIVRSSGRREKFDTDRMAKTVGRSGVPYLMARDIASKVSRKLLSRKSSKLPRKPGSPRRVAAATVRKLVAEELRQRNRPDIAASYVGEAPKNVYPDRYEMENSTEPVSDLVAANRSKLLFDGTSRSAKSTKAS